MLSPEHTVHTPRSQLFLVISPAQSTLASLGSLIGLRSSTVPPNITIETLLPFLWSWVHDYCNDITCTTINSIRYYRFFSIPVIFRIKYSFIFPSFAGVSIRYERNRKSQLPVMCEVLMSTQNLCIPKHKSTPDSMLSRTKLSHFILCKIRSLPPRLRVSCSASMAGV